MKNEVGDIVMVNGEKHIVTEVKNGNVYKTTNLFRYVASCLVDKEAQRTYFEVIMSEMDKYN